jgi:hypothetical protein
VVNPRMPSFLGLETRFLTCSSAAQVTKLCDLGADDNVCSVGWAQRGTHLAVGTNQGKVQVALHASTLN